MRLEIAGRRAWAEVSEGASSPITASKARRTLFTLTGGGAGRLVAESRK